MYSSIYLTHFKSYLQKLFTDFDLEIKSLDFQIPIEIFNVIFLEFFRLGYNLESIVDDHTFDN